MVHKLDYLAKIIEPPSEFTHFCPHHRVLRFHHQTLLRDRLQIGENLTVLFPQVSNLSRQIVQMLLLPLPRSPRRLPVRELPLLLSQEEHYISSLCILWPQVSCASDCPTRGSRVVFFSYIGSSSQTEKFAVRFNTSLMQDFLETIENICINERPVGAISLEDPATSDQIGSNRPENRSVGQSGSSNPPSPYTPALPVLSITDHESRYSQQQFLQDDVDAFSGMPPSFQELLNECSLQIGAGSDRADMNTEKIQSKSPLRDSLNADSVDDFLTSLEELMLARDADLKSLVEKCLADASFRGRRGGVVAKIKGLILITFASLDVSCGGYDLLADHLHMFFNLPDILSKIETVIDELGGESAQPI